MNLLLPCLLLIGWQGGPVQTPAKPVNPPPLNEVYWIDFHTSEQGQTKPPTSLEQAISLALVSHPDMRLAEAELRVAEAKLAQARIVVSQKVTEDFHRLEKERAEVTLAAANWERISQLQQKNMVSKQEVDESQHQLAQAKARLAMTESSWKLMMGNQALKVDQAGVVALRLNQYLDSQRQAEDINVLGQFYRLNANEVYSPVRVNSGTSTPGSIEQLKTHLDSKIKLEVKQTNLNLEQAFKMVTEVGGFKIQVKLPVKRVDSTHNLDAIEYPMHTWLQLIVDEMNNFQAVTSLRNQETPKRYELYVREYGLLLTPRDLAPSDAITVQELWKQTQFEKAAKEAKKSQENATPKK